MIELSGSQLSELLRSQIAKRVTTISKKLGRPPGLGVIIVGEDPASQVYVRNKILACQNVGIFSRKIALSAQSSESQITESVQELNHTAVIDGILLQLPLPYGMDARNIIEKIDPAKDVDGLTYLTTGKLFSGAKSVRPCTPAGVIEILNHHKIVMKGKKAVVVGRSHIVGRPMAELLIQNDATVTICHSATVNLRSYTSQADIVVVAAGKPQFLGREDFKAGSVVIDVGIHRTENGLCGDVRYAELAGHVQAATPVPKGVGPMTITMLLKNTCDLAETK